jgi:transposase
MSKVETKNTMDTPNTTSNKAWIGIDVSKDILDVYLIVEQATPSYGQFANQKKGYVQLVKWVKRLTPQACYHFCLEATGSYSTGLALFLAEAGLLVSVVNPYRAKHAAIAQGACNKTDKASAKSLAEYCRREEPPLWRVASPEVRTLVGLVRHLDNLKEQLVQQTNRRQEPELLAQVAASLDKMIQYTQSEIRSVEKEIDRHINDHPDLKADRDLLVSIPGIGKETAHQILAELPDVSEFASAQAAAAFAGLNPTEFRSGTSIRRRTRLSKKGNKHLRRALYMPALTALRYNACIQSMAERLRSRKKSHMAIVGAAMRKLLMIAFGVLRTRQPFRVDFALTRQNAY